MDTYVARQPIFDGHKRVRAYELLFRDGLDNAMPRIDGDTATSTLLSNSFFSIGLEKITGGKKAFINFTRKLLIDEIPLMFPRESTVVEVLENVKAEEAVVKACRSITEKGYLLALDDFVFEESLRPLMELAHIIKVDLRESSMDDVAALIPRLPNKKTILLAEKVETPAEFDQALDMGFGLFQGYFFSRPEILAGRGLSSNRMSLLRIMSEISRPEIDGDRLEACIAYDVSISYKLMKYINSSFFKRAREIASIRQAIVMLGEREIRRFLSLMVLQKLSTNKPNELMRVACVRAKFLEHLAEWTPPSLTGDALFTLGLFSNIDAILDQPMEAALQGLPLATEIIEALIHGRGPAVAYLQLALNFERGQWEKVHHMLTALSLPCDRIPEIYQTACYWSNTLRAK